MQRSLAAAERGPRMARDGDDGRSRDPSADAGAPTARSFAADAFRLARLIQADPHTQLAFTSVGGWDTHVNQGGPVAGGRVLGEWPGLDKAALADGRDLAVTTDFRAVLAPIVQQHLGLSDSALAQVFPGFAGALFKGPLLRA
jgi:uncharacterized protein (DUF1501 family)